LQIIYSKKAIKFLNKQNKTVQIRITTSIENLPLGDVKKLRGLGGYRLRVGDFRILFDKNGNIIDIIDIENRGQVYK